MPTDAVLRTAALAALAALAASAACGGGDPARQLPDAPPLADAATPDVALPPDAACTAGPVDTRIQISFDSKNAEWVKSLTWRDSSGTITGNLASSGGSGNCSSPNEMFGQLYGAPEGNQPYPIGGDTLATGLACGSDVTNTSAAMTCDAKPTPQLPITTEYHFYGGAQASQVRITRTIGFDATTPVYSGLGIRPYVPRLPIGTFTTVIYPDGSAAMTHTTGTCGGDCFTPVGATWNGHWIADVDPRSGLAMIVLRDPGMTSPVQFTVNNDSFSGSNLSSFVLVQPSAGWKAPITEIEYLCFADLASWPQALRDAAALPAGCGP